MKYFRFEEVEVEDFVKNLPSNYIATQGLTIPQIAYMFNEAIKAVTEETHGCGGECKCNNEIETKPYTSSIIDEIFDSIPQEKFDAVEEEMMEQITPKQKGRKKKHKPVVNNTLSKFLEKHKLID